MSMSPAPVAPGLVLTSFTPHIAEIHNLIRSLGKAWWQPMTPFPHRGDREEVSVGQEAKRKGNVAGRQVIEQNSVGLPAREAGHHPTARTEAGAAQGDEFAGRPWSDSLDEQRRDTAGWRRS